MKNYDTSLLSNTNSIAPFINNGTSVYPFIKSVYYIVNLVNYNEIIAEKTIEFMKPENEIHSSTVIKSPGFLKGTFIMTEDFDEPLDEFSDYL